MSEGMDLYFASCVPSGGILHYHVDPQGNPSFRDQVVLDRPMYLIRQDQVLLALLRAPFPDRNESALVRFAIAPDGSLKPMVTMVGTKGSVAAHLCCFRSSVYVANYLSGSLYRDDGLLCTHHGHGPDPLRQEAPHPHMIMPSPDGRYLIATDLGLDRIFVYDQDLREISQVEAPARSGPRHFATLDGGHILVVGELDCSVMLYAYEAGKLHLLSSLCLLPDPIPGATAAAIRVQGSMVYVSIRKADLLVVLSWDGRDLQVVQKVPCGGDSPRDIVIANGSLWCMNELSGTVVRFLLDSEGKIGKESENPIPIAHVLSMVAR